MNYSYEQNKSYAIKLTIFKVEKKLDEIKKINRDDYSNKELLAKIKRLEPKL